MSPMGTLQKTGVFDNTDTVLVLPTVVMGIINTVFVLSHKDTEHNEFDAPVFVEFRNLALWLGPLYL